MLSVVEKTLIMLGMLALATCTAAIAMGTRSREARTASRLGLYALMGSIGCMGILGVLNMSGATGPTVSFLYLGAIIVAWILGVMLPVSLWVQRVRRSKGWPPEFVSKDASDV